MRHILNISLPIALVREVKKEVKEGGYMSVSEFMRELLRAWREERIHRDLKKSQAEIRAGKGKRLISLADLK